MPDPNVEPQRTSVWEYVNPLSVADRPMSAYTSPFAAVIYGPYSAMAAGRGIAYPGVFPTFSSIPAIGSGARVIERNVTGLISRLPPSIRNNTIARAGGSFGHAVLFGTGFGEATSDARTLADAGSISKYLNIRAEARGSKAQALRSFRSSRGVGSQLGEGIIKAGAVKNISVPGRLTVGTVGRALVVKAGRLVGPVMSTLAVGQLAYFGAEAAYKGITAVGEMVDRATERIHSLELGGDLTRNFLTTQAATERQRAMQAIQASHLSGRRMMGSEATMAHQ